MNNIIILVVFLSCYIPMFIGSIYLIYKIWDKGE